MGGHQRPSPPGATKQGEKHVGEERQERQGGEPEVEPRLGQERQAGEEHAGKQRPRVALEEPPAYVGGEDAGAAPTGAVSVGGVGVERQVQNVAAGQLAATSSDAVNGSQLFATNTAIGTVGAKTDALGGSVATSLGGGAAYDPATGAVAAPAYTVAGNTYNNVGAAIGAGDRAAVQYAVDAAGNPLPAVDLTKGGTLAPVAVTGLANAATATGAVALGQMPVQYATVANPTPNLEPVCAA